MTQSTGAVEYTDCIFAEGKTSPQEMLTKQSDGETLLMLELWGMWSTSLLPLVPRPLLSTLVVSDRVLSMGQIEVFDI